MSRQIIKSQNQGPKHDKTSFVEVETQKSSEIINAESKDIYIFKNKTSTFPCDFRLKFENIDLHKNTFFAFLFLYMMIIDVDLKYSNYKM